jgi:transcriptional regulator with XRE-family HTH domain
MCKLAVCILSAHRGLVLDVAEGNLMMRGGESLLLQRRRLRTELRAARQGAGLTQDQVAKAMDWSLSKVIRIEATNTSASSNISTNDLKALISLYGITDRDRADELIELARAGRVRPWWNEYKNVAPAALLELIEYESAASAIRQSETLFIPGVLQTEEYATAVLEEGYGDRMPAAERRELIRLRTRRQELVGGDDPPTFFFRLDEAAVRRVVGSPAVMRAQLRDLINLADRPNVTVEIMPFSAGLHSGMRGPFEIIEFAARKAVGDVVFLESPLGDTISEDAAVVSEYHEAFERLGKSSLNARETIAYLKGAIDELA